MEDDGFDELGWCETTGGKYAYGLLTETTGGKWVCAACLRRSEDKEN